ncbi:MAG TPA: right-handed parallel beta-helix repeat-containing protein [Candidatus Humimicrobiaceae bacterium]|nr:right-handed parallel beta-helix repeat-containing protein [Candidatus Humimicrobiaceae bacterium]
MNIKILIILIVLVGLCVGGVFIWKNISGPEEEKEKKDEEIILEEELSPEEISNTTRAGMIERDEIWKGEIYIIGDIIVEEGVTLSIEPGTRVLIAANQDVENLFDWPFDMQQGIRQELPGEDPYYQGVHFGEPFRDEGNHISIRIHGTLHAVGTPEQIITITSDSPTPGIYDWNSFQFDRGIFSYCIIEYYRGFNPGNGTVVSHNILRHVGECAVCANSSVVAENNMIYDAGHELVDMHNASPTIRDNTIGSNKNRCCIVIDGGSPLITGNTIKDCRSGLLLLVPPEDQNLKDNILKDNTFLNNGQNVSYGY